ncbi:MAG: hypothetical protein FDZ69_06590 [Deltaproteobacteria bacterium]|nr:MAG: hypothetical protein FDZ69_06590 [Deltaproteobacteria bacterium]
MFKTILLLLPALWSAAGSASALEITSVAPGRGVPDTRVVLTGGPFTAQSRIYLGEQYVPPLQLLPRQMDFIVPAVPPGSYSLTVQDDIDMALQPVLFEVLAPPPQIAAIEPRNLDFCADRAGRSVRVEGRHFLPATQLLLNGTVVGSRFLDAGALEFDLPELPAGVYGVEARNPDGTASLPHSLWINSLPEISTVEQGDDFVNHYEMLIHGKNFFFNSILVVRETDRAAGGMGTRQTTYYAHRNAPLPVPSNLPAAGEQLRYADCHTLVYLRYPSNFQEKELTLQVINPDGKKTEPYVVTMP